MPKRPMIDRIFSSPMSWPNSDRKYCGRRRGRRRRREAAAATRARAGKPRLQPPAQGAAAVALGRAGAAPRPRARPAHACALRLPHPPHPCAPRTSSADWSSGSSSVRCWWYWPMRRWLCRFTMPSSGSSCPVMSLSRVDLPAPLGPTWRAGAGAGQGELRPRRSLQAAPSPPCPSCSCPRPPPPQQHTQPCRSSSAHNGHARVQVSAQVDVAVQHLVGAVAKGDV